MPLDTSSPSFESEVSSSRSSTPRILPKTSIGKPSSLYRAAHTETRLHLTQGQTSRLRYLAEITYPFEACGLLVGTQNERVVQVKEVLQANNLTEYGSRDRYVLDPEDFLTAERCARDRGLRIVGIWHSHPNHPAEPSTKDVKAAWHGYSYVIVSVDALGDTVVRSWRLKGSNLAPEPIEVISEVTSIVPRPILEDPTV